MSILFHHYKELNQCIKEVEQIEEARASSKKKGLRKAEEQRQAEEESPLQSKLLDF
jgi:hypothetical protein